MSVNEEHKSYPENIIRYWETLGKNLLTIPIINIKVLMGLERPTRQG